MPKGVAEPRTGAERYFAKRQESEDYALAYKHARAEIDEIDRLVRRVDEAREQQGLSKADLARMAGLRPEAVRRIFTAKSVNPTIQTMVAMTTALGLKLDVHEASPGEGTSVGSRASRQRVPC